MGRIPLHVIDQIRERANLVEIVGRYVTLRKAGSRHWGLCPFHHEKTPSFQVLESKQIFHCFGCGVGGDVFSFRMRHDGLDFPDAVRAVAREVGVPIPEATDRAGGPSSAALFAANELAASYYESILRASEGDAARRYLKSRGVDGALARRFQIGAAPSGWDGLVRFLDGEGVTRRVAQTAGLIAPKRSGEGYYDRFRARILFAIAEPSGRVIGFGARSLGETSHGGDATAGPKYLNSPETPIYHKGRVLFGLPQALPGIRERGRVIVVEGYFDVLALHRAGLTEAVAPCGTALTADHARRLRRYTGEVVLLFDGDDAGRQAAARSLPVLLAEGLHVRGALLPRGEDPDSLLEREGESALRACVDSAAPLLDQLIDRQIAAAGTHAWGASDTARALAPLIAAIADPIERDRTVHELATRLSLRVETLEAALTRAAQRPGARRETPNPPESHIEKEATIDPVSRVLLEAATGFPDLVHVIGKLPLDWLPPGSGRDLVETVLARAAEVGDDAIPRLCAEHEGSLPPATQRALRQLVMRAGLWDRAEAVQAVRDCLARLESRGLDRELRALRTRIESSGDPLERESLLEQMQSRLEQRRALEADVA